MVHLQRPVESLPAHPRHAEVRDDRLGGRVAPQEPEGVLRGADVRHPMTAPAEVLHQGERHRSLVLHHEHVEVGPPNRPVPGVRTGGRCLAARSAAGEAEQGARAPFPRPAALDHRAAPVLEEDMAPQLLHDRRGEAQSQPPARPRPHAS
jgi:hypothetical protein